MQITVQLPDDLAQHPDPGREALEALMIEGYRSGVLTQFQLATMLGLARLEIDDFLAKRGISEHAYDMVDLERDRQSIRELRAEGLAHQ